MRLLDYTIFALSNYQRYAVSADVRLPSDVAHYFIRRDAS